MRVESSLKLTQTILDALLDCAIRHFAVGPSHPFILNWSGGEIHTYGIQPSQTMYALSLTIPSDSITDATTDVLEKAMSEQVASCLLQSKLREIVDVAFVMNGSLLPRKSGGSHEPMEGAVPFTSPPSLEKVSDRITTIELPLT